jgi:hypothetical protein
VVDLHALCHRGCVLGGRPDNEDET